MKAGKMVKITFLIILASTAALHCGWRSIFLYDEKLEQEAIELNKIIEELEYNELKIRGFRLRGSYIDYYFDPLNQARLSEGWLNRPSDRLHRRVDYMRRHISSCILVSGERKNNIRGLISEISGKLENTGAERIEERMRLKDLLESFNNKLAAYESCGNRMARINKALDECDKTIVSFNKIIDDRINKFDEAAAGLNDIAEKTSKIAASADPAAVEGYDTFFEKGGLLKTIRLRRIFESIPEYFQDERYLPVDNRYPGLKNAVRELEYDIFVNAENVRTKIAGDFAISIRDFEFLGRNFNDYRFFALTEIYNEELINGLIAVIRFRYSARGDEISHFLVNLSKNDEWIKIDLPEDGSVDDAISPSISGEFEFSFPVIAGKIYSPEIICVSRKSAQTNSLIRHPYKFIFMGRSKEETIQEAVSRFEQGINNNDWTSLKASLAVDFEGRDIFIEGLKAKRDSLKGYKLKTHITDFSLSNSQDTAEVVFEEHYDGAIVAPTGIKAEMLFKVEKNRAKIAYIKNPGFLTTVEPAVDYTCRPGRNLTKGTFKLWSILPDGGFPGYSFESRKAPAPWYKADIFLGLDGGFYGASFMDIGSIDPGKIGSAVNPYIFEALARPGIKPRIGRTYLLRDDLGRYAVINVNESGSEHTGFRYLFRNDGVFCFSH